MALGVTLSRRAGVLLAAVVVVVATVACGGPQQKQVQQQSPATRAPSTPQPKRPANLRLLRVSVLDGDTWARLADATITARGTVKLGQELFTRPGLRSLTLTSWAPHYGARTLYYALGPARKLTVRLYRTDGQWTMYGVTPARTQAHSGIRLRPPFRVVWGRNLGTLLEFPAVIDNGVAYLSNLHGKLYALSMADGHPIWQYDMHSTEQDSSPAVVGDQLVAHSKSGRVLVLSRAGGRLLWSWPTAGRIESSPVVEHGIDYLGDWAGNVYALDLHSRRARWVYHDGCKITASVTIAGGALYLGDYCGRGFALE
jgi:hypothetical protein